MANIILFNSSLICSLAHIIVMILYPPSFVYGSFLTLALTTSVCNHGLTSDVWKWSDRVVMVVGSGVTIYMAPSTTVKSLVLLLGLLYGAAKNYAHVGFHLGAHGLLTLVNIHILYTNYYTLICDG